MTLPEFVLAMIATLAWPVAILIAVVAIKTAPPLDESEGDHDG